MPPTVAKLRSSDDRAGVGEGAAEPAPPDFLSDGLLGPWPVDRGERLFEGGGLGAGTAGKSGCGFTLVLQKSGALGC